VSTQIEQPTHDEIVAQKSARAVDERALRTIFTDAHSANRFLPKPVPRELLKRAVELTEHGPTSANTLPLRIVFVESAEAKERLRPALSAGNVDKTMSAPVTAIVAADLEFYEHIPRLFPQKPEMKNVFAGPERAEFSRAQAFMNATLQGGYFILAVRSLGLDAGPMGGFDREKTDATFFPDGKLKSIFLVALGYADDTKSFPRGPRFAVDEIVRFE